MKKIFLGLLALTAIVLVGCKEQKYTNKDLVQSLQKDRETLTTAETYLFQDFYETDSTRVISLILTSANAEITYGEIYFDALAGTGSALNLVLISDTSANNYPAAGVYVKGEKDEAIPFTYDPDKTYMTILNGSTNKMALQDAQITVSVSGEVYTIALAGVMWNGQQLKATYNGKLDGKDPYFFREPTQADSIKLEAAAVSYAADESNYEEWANDSAYSYYAEMYAFYAEYYYQLKDSATGDMYAYYAAQYATMKEANTPMNIHYFTLASADGDVLNIEIDLERLDPEFTENIPSGKYPAVPGYCDIEKVGDLWTSNWKYYPSYMTAADGSVYYLQEAIVDVVMANDTVKSINVAGTTANGSALSFTYGDK